jgi:hypothetical protein
MGRFYFQAPSSLRVIFATIAAFLEPVTVRGGFSAAMSRKTTAGAQMVQHTRRRVAATLAISLAAGIGTAEVSRAADECLAGPTGAAPQGSHWYYRVDRATRRNCWYLRPEGSEVRRHAQQDGSPALSHPSNTMSAQPASQTPTEARMAEAAGAGPLAAEPLPVEMAAVEAKTAEVAAELLPVEKVPGPELDDSEIE